METPEKKKEREEEELRIAAEKAKGKIDLDNDDNLDDLFEEIDLEDLEIEELKEIIEEEELEVELTDDIKKEDLLKLIAEARDKKKPVETEEEKEIREKKEQEEKDKAADTGTDDEELKKLRLKVKELELSKANPPKPKKKFEGIDDLDEDKPLTLKQLRTLQAKEISDEVEQRTTYQKDYVLSIYHEAVEEGMSDLEFENLMVFIAKPENINLDKKHSDNGTSDGMVNFHKTMRALKKDPKINLKHNPAPKDGPTKKTNLTKKRVKESKLDKFSQRFLDKCSNSQRGGMSKESVAEALENTEGMNSRDNRL